MEILKTLNQDYKSTLALFIIGSILFLHNIEVFVIVKTIEVCNLLLLFSTLLFSYFEQEFADPPLKFFRTRIALVQCDQIK